MKTIAKILLVLGPLACILSITSADNTTVPSTDQTTKPDGQTTKTTPSSIPSLKDMAKAADPSFAASELEAPVRWMMNGMYYIWHYLLYDPVAISVDLAMEPITLSYDAIAGPINLIFSPILKPISKFAGKQYNKTKTLIWWSTLESISYGSGATAETVSSAMEMAMNGIIEFFTSIGLPLANTAEKLATLTDQMAKTRKKRSVTGAFGELGSGIGSIMKFPFSLLGGIFSIITFPIRMIFGMVKLPFSLLFGSSANGNSTYTLMLTDMNTEKITNMVMDEAFKFMKNTGLPELDVMAHKLKDSTTVPKKFRDVLSEFDSMYKVLKMFGYVK